VFDTVYKPGKLEAVAYKAGKETGRFALETAEEATAIKAEVEKPTVKAEPEAGDLAYINISLVDAKGRVNTAACKNLTVSVSGPAVLQGFGNANPSPEDSCFTDNTHDTYYGRALAVVRPCAAGKVSVTVEAEGLKPVSVIIEIK
jgi:beta-galactosidase